MASCPRLQDRSWRRSACGEQMCVFLWVGGCVCLVRFVWVCFCVWVGGGGGGAEGLETAVVGGVNPTHYNSSLWPVLGKRGTTGAYRHILSICISPFSPLQVAPDCTDSNQPLLTVPLSAHDPSHDCRMQWMMMMMQN